MGMIRKLTSLSTVGMVSYRSPRERQAAAAQMDARARKKLLREEAALVRAQREAIERGQ